MLAVVSPEHAPVYEEGGCLEPDGAAELLTAGQLDQGCELAREVFCSRQTVLLSGLFVTLTWNNNVDRHRFLCTTELNANRNETLLPAARVSRINIHRRDVHVPPMC
jgi:hypothetical protein